MDVFDVLQSNLLSCAQDAFRVHTFRPALSFRNDPPKGFLLEAHLAQDLIHPLYLLIQFILSYSIIILIENPAPNDHSASILRMAELIRPHQRPLSFTTKSSFIRCSPVSELINGERLLLNYCWIYGGNLVTRFFRRTINRCESKKLRIEKIESQKGLESNV